MHEAGGMHTRKRGGKEVKPFGGTVTSTIFTISGTRQGDATEKDGGAANTVQVNTCGGETQM